MKKQLIKVEAYPTESPVPYKKATFCQAWVSISETGKRKQVTPNVSCREALIRRAWDSFNGRVDSNSLTPVDFSKTRLLITKDPEDVAEFKKRLFNGKAALNLLEDINGWTRSTITTVSHPFNKNVWLLTGPKEWMSQPQLTSLATWIIRLAAKDGPFEVDSVANFKKSLYKLKQDVHSGIRQVTDDNRLFLNAFYEKMFVLLGNHKEIFKDINLMTAWAAVSENQHFGVYSGFHSFILGNAVYSAEIIEAKKRFTALCAEQIK